MDIRNAIRQLALSGSEMYLTVCTVDAVDEDARTIDCTPINEGAPLLAVNLQADQNQTVGTVSFPAVGSEVVVGFLNPAVAVVVLAMEITKSVITIGDTEATVEDNSVVLKTQKGSATLTADNLKIDIDGTTLEMKKGVSVWNGGSETTANATELQKQLNICKARIDAIINALKSSAVAPQDGGATYKANISTALSGLTSEDYSNMIDDKIKH